MAKRRKKKKKEDARPWSMSNPHPDQRNCVVCGRYWIESQDYPGSGLMCVWARRQLKGPLCCEGATLPANHLHAGCTQCGATWIEDLDGVVKEIRNVAGNQIGPVREVSGEEADDAED
jgi:hypothetical protein